MKEGDKVKVKDGEVDKYVKVWAKRVAGRVGIVQRGQSRHNYCRVKFPAIGRKKEFDAGWIHRLDLELVEQSGA